MRLFLLLILMIVLLASFGAVMAAQRQSPTYRIILDCISSSGGKASSPKYRQTDCAMGQETACGPSAASGMKNNAGIVQPWQSLKTDSSNWVLYE